MKFCNILLDFVLYFLAPFFSILKIWKIPQSLNIGTDSIHDERNCYTKIISQEDIKVVMERLGIGYARDSNYQLAAEEDSLGMGADEFAETFEEKPSLEEVKEAFEVFDENRDGFIDATDLQRVLRCLGVKENLVQLKDCTMMIKVADEDDDGRIDFNEFVKFMETCFL